MEDDWYEGGDGDEASDDLGPWGDGLDGDLPDGVRIMRDDDRDWHDEEYAGEGEKADEDEEGHDQDDSPPAEGPIYDPPPRGGHSSDSLADDGYGGRDTDGGGFARMAGSAMGGDEDERPTGDGDESESDAGGGRPHGIRGWLQSVFGGKKDDEPEPMEQTLAAAEQKVAEYHNGGACEAHHAQVGDGHYKGSLEYEIASQIETLEGYLQKYEDEANSGTRDAYLVDETWGRRIAVLLNAINEAEATLESLDGKESEVDAQWRDGQLSESAYADALWRLGRKRQRSISKLGMGGLGMTYDDIGEVSDQAGHIIADTLADDGGAARQEIAQRIRGLPRRAAIDMLERMVADGVISREMADHLRFQYVRSR